jgi:hypothetical protein
VGQSDQKGWIATKDQGDRQQYRSNHRYDGVGLVNPKRMVSGSLASLGANTIISGGIYDISYDGTQFQIGVPGGGFTMFTRVITSSTTYTPTTGLLYGRTFSVGGGAGGKVGGTVNNGSGGGSGAEAEGLFDAATIGASQTATIGSGGASSTNGGTTSLGSLISCPGGSTGTSTSSIAFGVAMKAAQSGRLRVLHVQRPFCYSSP